MKGGTQWWNGIVKLEICLCCGDRSVPSGSRFCRGVVFMRSELNGRVSFVDAVSCFQIL